jgi:hypothetical protein
MSASTGTFSPVPQALGTKNPGAVGRIEDLCFWRYSEDRIAPSYALGDLYSNIVTR